MSLRKESKQRSRFIGLTLEAWFLLLIPVGIAFAAGYVAPNLLGYDFSIVSGLIWAFVIFVVDMLIIKTVSNILVNIFRLILVSLSIVITATVLDMKVFEQDINSRRETRMEANYRSALSIHSNDVDAIYQKMLIEEKNGGRGVQWQGLYDEWITTKNNKPNKSDIKGGLLENIQILHEIILDDVMAMGLFFGWMILVAILEALPMILKNATLKRQYR